MATKYLKLSANASIFRDIATGMLLRQGEVVKVDDASSAYSSGIATAVNNGFLVVVSSTEYNNYLSARVVTVQQSFATERNKFEFSEASAIPQAPVRGILTSPTVFEATVFKPGDRIIIGDLGTVGVGESNTIKAFRDREGLIAEYTGKGWAYQPPGDGLLLVNLDNLSQGTEEKAQVVYNGNYPDGSWVVFSNGGISSGGGSQVLVDGSTVTMDYSLGSTASITVNGLRPFTIEGTNPGDNGTILVIQGATGGGLQLQGVKPAIRWAPVEGERDLLKFTNIEGTLHWVWQSYAHNVPLTQMILTTPNAGYPRAVLDVNGGYVGMANNQTEYVELWNSSPINSSQAGDIIAGSTPYTFLGISGIGITELQVRYMDEILLTNFNNLVIPSFPVGVFGTDATFQANVADMPALIAQRNASYTGSGITSYADIGTGYSIGALKTSPTAFAADFRTMRYWYVSATGASNIYTSGSNIIRKPDGAQVVADSGTLGVFGAPWNFGLNTITYGVKYTDISPTADVPLVDTTSPFYINALVTGGPNYIYHNEIDGEWAVLDVFNNCTNNGGNLPPSVRFVGMQRFNADNNAVGISLGNVLNLSSLFAIEYIAFNGIGSTGPGIVYNKLWLNYMPNLKAFFAINRSAAVTTDSLTSLGINKTTLPNLEFLGYRKSPGSVFTIAPGDFSQLPPLTKGMDLLAVGINAAGEDQILNEMVTALGTATAYTTARINTQYQNSVRTSASDAAYATLTSKGFTVV